MFFRNNNEVKLKTIEADFKTFVVDEGCLLSDLSVNDGFTLFLKFYQTKRVKTYDIQKDEDMLLFEYGVYDWGDGESFYLSFTRQLSSANPRAKIWQFKLQFKFPVEERLTEIQGDNLWCSDLNGLEVFMDKVVTSPAFQTVADSRNGELRLTLFSV